MKPANLVLSSLHSLHYTTPEPLQSCLLKASLHLLEMSSPTETHVLQAVNTAKSPSTIWSRISQNEFRQNVVSLEEKTNAVPVDVFTVNLSDAKDTLSHGGALPLAVEKQTADDLAYLAAVTEGAQSVAAVCLEQHSPGCSTSSLVIKIAGMDVVDESVRLMLGEICEILQHVSSGSSGLEMQGSQPHVEAVFRLIVEQHRQKLLGRLRSKKWTKPAYLARTHKKSLWKDFENVIHRAQHVYPKRLEKTIRIDVQNCLTALGETYQKFEDTAEDVQQMLQHLVRSTYEFCQSTSIAAYAKKLEGVHATPQIAAALKTLRQLEKIGAYWRISKALIKTARSYSSLFQNISIEYITPYASVPTKVAYESWAKTCHVHAEVQLAVHYALSATNSSTDSHAPATLTIWPRIIGTIPDLEVYSAEVREHFSMVLECMNNHVSEKLKETTSLIWRPEPMTSRQDLLCYQQNDIPTEELEDAMRRTTLSDQST
ncbi:hypothetical protein AC578_4493 [Pseudocercospora eumusae]|uniref:Uncharacterized protein n=1 Tax=Pseudocercospora eumusae TaxID=321146 RepID=A0A139HBP3_9PEZI|nr:hypothetical protein AC578_4493 [Pseudocercospora eumusae]